MWKVFHTISFYLPLHQSKAHYGLIVSLVSKHGFVTGLPALFYLKKVWELFSFHPSKELFVPYWAKVEKIYQIILLTIPITFC